MIFYVRISMVLEIVLVQVTQSWDLSWVFMILLIIISILVLSSFDKEDHQILLNKPFNHLFREPVLQLIKLYLTERKQFVFCNNNNISVTLSITIGVPQGSVLGPLMFWFTQMTWEISSLIIMHPECYTLMTPLYIVKYSVSLFIK